MESWRHIHRLFHSEVYLFLYVLYVSLCYVLYVSLWIQLNSKFIVQQYDEREQLNPMSSVKNLSTEKKKALMWACEFPLPFEDSEMCVGFSYFPDRLFVKRHDPQSGSTFLSELRSIRCIMTSSWSKIWQQIQKEEKRNIISATRDALWILLKICLQFFLVPASKHKQTILKFQH